MNPPTTTTTEPAGELLTGEALERRLEELLHQDHFKPTAEFLASERVNEASLHAQADLDANGFWADQARKLHRDEPFMTVLDDSKPPFYKWFTDGKLNVSYNCVDRHVEAGRGNRVAFHWAGEEGEQRAVVVAMLPCARIGAPHNVVFGGFAPEAVKERMEVSHAKALITVDGGQLEQRIATEQSREQ